MGDSCTASPCQPEGMYRENHSYGPYSDEMLTKSFGNLQVSSATCGCDEEAHPFTQSLDQFRITSSSHSGCSSRNSYYKCFGDEYTLQPCDQDMSSVSEAATVMDTTLSTMWSGSELDSLDEGSSTCTTGSGRSSSDSTQPRVSFTLVTTAGWCAHNVKHLKY